MANFVKKHHFFLVLITLAVLILGIFTALSFYKGDNGNSYVTASKLKTIKIGSPEDKIRETFGKPSSTNSDSRNILRELKKYNKFKNVSDKYLGSELSKVTEQINTHSLSSVLNMPKDSDINLLQYPYGKEGNGSVMLIFKDSKLIYVFMIND